MLVRALVLAFVLVAWDARADAPRGLQLPERLTAGVADQFLGQLAPDQKTLFYISSRNTVNELYAEDVGGGRSRLVFDENADVTWPRLRKDGRAVLYISARDHAEGQLCVRDLPDGGGRRCLDGPAVLQAEWIDQGRIVVVERASIQSDLRLAEVTVGSGLAERTLLEANATSPAVSPDGRWLVYVPLERYGGERIGAAFASHVAKRLALVDLTQPHLTPLNITLDLPGSTGQPAFARDGRSVYVAQFFSDSNHDGVVDGNDHGVLFRVPFALVNGQPTTGEPVQLTDTLHNCQYPAPTTDRLLATCMGTQNLDLYSVPLDGEVPHEWDAARLTEEIEVTTSPAIQLLLYRHRLARETTLADRRRTLLQLVRLHTDLEEFRAAEHYAKRLVLLDDVATGELTEPLLMLVAHRRSVRARERGRDTEDFRAITEDRLGSLDPTRARNAPAAVLVHVVRSELEDAIGEKGKARAELEAAVIDDDTPPSVADFYYERADALYRELDDRDALVAACRKLAARRSETPDHALRFARAAVRAIVRGLPWNEADLALSRARPTEGEEEMAFAVDLGRALLAVRSSDPPEAVTAALLALYQQQTRGGRRRVLVNDSVARASQLGADRVIERLSVRYVDDSERGTVERRRAERLYGRALVGRAYRRAEAGRIAEARADFEAVARRTHAHEAVAEAIELRRRTGETSASIAADERAYGEVPGAHAFVRAYLLATSLDPNDPRRRAEMVTTVMDAVRQAWTDLKGSGVVRSMVGAMLHEQYLATRDPALAERANVQLLVALEMVKADPRFQALVLDQLAALQLEVGNYRIALGYLKARDALPILDDDIGLWLRLAKARALLHVGNDAEAAAAADKAVEAVGRTPGLAPYRQLVLDRAALDNLAAQRFDRASALYDLEVPLADAGPEDAVARHNRFVVRLGRAAAKLGVKDPRAAVTDLLRVQHDLGDPRVTDALAWPHADHEHVLRQYRLLDAGLRAHAYHDLSRHDDEARALDERRAVIAQMWERANRGEHLRALSLVESQLAENALERRDAGAAARWARASLQHADDLHGRGTEAIDTKQLDVLWLAAKLAGFDHIPLALDLHARLTAATSDLGHHPGAHARGFVPWLEACDVLVH